MRSEKYQLDKYENSAREKHRLFPQQSKLISVAPSVEIKFYNLACTLAGPSSTSVRDIVSESALVTKIACLNHVC